MPAMSRGSRARGVEPRGPNTPPTGKTGGRLAELAAIVVVPIAAGSALLAIATESSQQVDSDLQLVAPDHVVPGETVPIRAQLYTQLHRPEGAQLVHAAVELTLRSASGGVLVRASLAPSYGRSLDAVLALPVPTPPTRAARVVARARVGHTVQIAERELQIGDARPVAAWHARSLPPLQRFAMAKLRIEAPPRSAGAVPPEAPPRSTGAVAPIEGSDALYVRVGQGTCVPEEACELFVYVGAPVASIRLLGTASAAPDARSAQPVPATSDVVALHVTTHGPEAETTVVAERDGGRVVSRALRLPVALGASVVRAPARVLPAPALPSVGLSGQERGCVVDAFREQRWLRTGSLRECNATERLPFAALEPGLWRLQLRRDPFAVESAAVFTLYVRAADESSATALARMAAAALEREPDDPLANAVQRAPDAFVAGFDPTAGYLLALLDAGVLELPAPVSSYPRAVAHMRAERSKLRAVGLCVLALCALSVGLLVAERGLRAAAVASRVMREAGEAPEQLDRQRARMALRVLATVTSLLLAFAAIALYMIVRSRGT
jgi:hypothetical protein